MILVPMNSPTVAFTVVGKAQVKVRAWLRVGNGFTHTATPRSGHRATGGSTGPRVDLTIVA